MKELSYDTADLNIAFADEQSKENFRLACANQRNDRGFVPMVVIIGPPSSGKSALARLIAIRACEEHDLVTLPPPQPDEWRWVLSLVLERKAVLLDCFRGFLDSADLAHFVTCSRWSFRPLHSSELVTRPCNTLVIVAGCDIQLAGDLDRRARVIVLETPAAV